MAKLSDLPVAFRRVGFFRFILRVWREIADDHLLTWAAALAYSWLFAIFPFLIFLLTLVPYLPANFTAETTTALKDFLFDWLPPQAAPAVWDNIKGVLERPRADLLSMGLAITIWAASSGVSMTMTALDRCYEVEGTRSFIRQRISAIGLTLIVASMVLGVLLLMPIATIGTRHLLDYLARNNLYVPAWIVNTWHVVRYLIASVLMFTTVGTMYHWGTNIKQKWRLITPGSVFTISVWLLLALVFRAYVEHFGRESYDRTYGTVGGVAVLLLFFYLDAMVLMIGAELNSEIDFEILGIPRGSQDFSAKPQPMFTDASQPSAP